MTYEEWKKEVRERNGSGIVFFAEAVQAVEIETITTEEKENEDESDS